MRGGSMIFNPVRYVSGGGVDIGAEVEITIVNNTSKQLYIYPGDHAEGSGMLMPPAKKTTKCKVYMGKVWMLAGASGDKCTVTAGEAATREGRSGNFFTCIMGEGAALTVTH